MESDQLLFLGTTFRFLDPAVTISLPNLFLAISVSQSLVLDAGLLTVEELGGAGLCLGLRPSTTRLGRFAVGDLLHASMVMEEDKRAERTGVIGSMLVEEEETGVRGKVNFFKGEPSLRGEATRLVGDW